VQGADNGRHIPLYAHGDCWHASTQQLSSAGRLTESQRSMHAGSYCGPVTACKLPAATALPAPT
jgi:hypothetical protein